MGLRIYIDGDWDAAEFAAFFNSLDDLYNHVCLTLERDLFPEFGRMYAFGRHRLSPDFRYRLTVKEIEYASPGHTDLVGIAAAMREIREFLQFIIRYMSERKDRELSREKSKLELASAKIELLERAYRLEKEFGPAPPMDAEQHLGIKSRKLPELDPLIQAVLDGRVKKVSDQSQSDPN